jgi:hypothetical protein
MQDKIFTLWLGVEEKNTGFVSMREKFVNFMHTSLANDQLLTKNHSRKQQF